ncbi:hypothetical protein MRX96_044205 [Rhipicephalus microplus]
MPALANLARFRVAVRLRVGDVFFLALLSRIQDQDPRSLECNWYFKREEYGWDLIRVCNARKKNRTLPWGGSGRIMAGRRFLSVDGSVSLTLCFNLLLAACLHSVIDSVGLVWLAARPPLSSLRHLRPLSFTDTLGRHAAAVFARLRVIAPAVVVQ